MKKISYYIIIFILLTTISSAQTLIDKEIPTITSKGENVQITITITNTQTIPVNLEVIETIPSTLELVNPQIPTDIQFFNAVKVSILKWDINLEPKESKNLTYTIKSLTLGNIPFTPTKIKDLSTEILTMSDTKNILVTCIQNNICDETENYLNCPSDCSSGSQDGVCNYILDGQCDPDCESDPDCEVVSFNYLPYIIISASLISLLILITMFRKFRS